MSTHVALLRAINVSGRNMLPMTTLVAMFEKLGCRNVRTYIQSGNVVFEATDALARRVPVAIAAAIRDQAGFEVPVLTRTDKELLAVAKGHAFAKRTREPKALHVAFLAEAPTAARILGLDPKRSPPDEFVVKGREIHLLLPNGVGRSKLTNAYFDARLATVSTIRNAATIAKLVELCDG